MKYSNLKMPIKAQHNHTKLLHCNFISMEVCICCYIVGKKTPQANN